MKKSPKAPAYRNPKLTPERRTKDLLARMVLEEKAAQMICVWQKKAETLVDADGQFDRAKAKSVFKKGHGLGQVGRLSDAGQGLSARAMAEVANEIQRFFLEESRMGQR
jgi:beta-glucosidase